MNHLFAPTIFMVILCRLPTSGQTVIDSLPDTVAQIPDSAATIPVDSDSVPPLLFSPIPAPAAPEQNLAEAIDSVKNLGIPADSIATSEKPQDTAPVKQTAPSGADRSSSTTMVLSDPDAVRDFIIGNNYRLPVDRLFLLGGKNLFIVSARPSQNIILGISGGPFFGSELHVPYGIIYDTQATAEDSIENDLGIYAWSNDFCNNINFKIANDIPFDEQFLFDDSYFWRDSTSEMDFVSIELNALQMYFNAHFPLGILSLKIKPLAFGKHIVAKSALFRSEFDPAQNQMMFAKAGEITTDFAVRNFGINTDVVFTRQVNKVLSIYARCPVEYRKITTAATRSISAQFSYYPDDWEYTRYVKLDTLPVAAYRGNSYYFEPRLGLRLDSKANLTWPFAFLPFIAQNGTIEGYFRKTHYLWQSKHEFNPEFGGSYTSLQNIRFGNRFFTGMENTSRLYFKYFYYTSNKDYYAYLISEYAPQLIVKEHFFVSGFRIRTRHYWPFNCNELRIDLFNQISFGYFNDTWGLSCNVGLKEAGDKRWYPDVLNVMVWRGWK